MGQFLVMPTLFGTGFQVPLIQCPAFVRGGSKVVGQVVEFDFANSDTATTDNNMDGGDNSGFGNVIATTTAGATTRRKIYGIVEGAFDKTAAPGTTVADDREALITLYGVTRALVFDATGALAKNDDLYVIAGASPASATGLVDVDATFVIDVEYPIVGMCLETVADADPEILASIWFWGGLPFGARQGAAA